MMRARRLNLTTAAVLGALGLWLTTGSTSALAGGPPEEPVTSIHLATVTYTSAVLEGVLNPHAGPTAKSGWYFAYGSEGTCNGGSTTPQEAEVEGEAIPEHAEVTGLEPGKTYTFCLIATNEADEITQGAEVSFTTPTLPPPAVSTGEALSAGQTSAQVTGTVNPNGLASSYEYRYGLSETADEQSSLVADLAAGNSEEVAPGSLTDLRPGTVYYYRLIATNDDGTTTGTVNSVTTLPATPPGAVTGTASAVSQNGATLEGTIATNGLPTNYGFEIATEAGRYGPATGLDSLSGVATETERLTLTELQPGTTYYYRVYASNADGNVQGAPQMFTTPGFPTLIAPPASPPLIVTTTVAFPAEAKTTTSTPKALTKARKLAAALKTCKKDVRHAKRQKCEKEARAKYGPARTRMVRKK